MSPLDNAPFNSVPAQPDLTQLINQARQNPRAFEEHIARNNPEAYQRAMQIRNSPNPQAIVMQMAQARGINPNVLKMLGIG